MGPEILPVFTIYAEFLFMAPDESVVTVKYLVLFSAGPVDDERIIQFLELAGVVGAGLSRARHLK